MYFFTRSSSSRRFMTKDICAIGQTSLGSVGLWVFGTGTIVNLFHRIETLQRLREELNVSEGIWQCHLCHSVGGDQGVLGPSIKSFPVIVWFVQELGSQHSASQTCPQCRLDSDRAALCHWFSLLFLWTGFLNALNAGSLVWAPQGWMDG